MRKSIRLEQNTRGDFNEVGTFEIYKFDKLEGKKF